MTPIDIATPLITTFEGVRLKAYQDTGGVWTIGVGDTGPDVKEGLVITYADAMQRLAGKIQPLYVQVIHTNLPIIAAAAYISFGYNCGLGALRKVLMGQDSISNPKYTHDMKGNVLPGLVNRRALEIALISGSQQ